MSVFFTKTTLLIKSHFAPGPSLFHRGQSQGFPESVTSKQDRGERDREREEKREKERGREIINLYKSIKETQSS